MRKIIKNPRNLLSALEKQLAEIGEKRKAFETDTKNLFKNREEGKYREALEYGKACEAFIKHYAKNTDLEPWVFAGIYECMAYCYQYTQPKDLKNAIKYYIEALKFLKDSEKFFDIHHVLMHCYFELNRNEEALEKVEYLLKKIDSEHVKPLHIYNAVITKIEIDKKKLTDQEIKLLLNKGKCYGELAKLALNEEKLEEAEKFANEAIKSKICPPSLAKAYGVLSIIKLNRVNFEKKVWEDSDHNNLSYVVALLEKYLSYENQVNNNNDLLIILKVFSSIYSCKKWEGYDLKKSLQYDLLASEKGSKEASLEAANKYHQLGQAEEECKMLNKAIEQGSLAARLVLAQIRLFEEKPDYEAIEQLIAPVREEDLELASIANYMSAAIGLCKIEIITVSQLFAVDYKFKSIDSIKKSIEDFVKWIKPCAKNNGSASYLLARLYHHIKNSYPKAEKYYRLAIALGCDKAVSGLFELMLQSSLQNKVQDSQLGDDQSQQEINCLLANKESEITTVLSAFTPTSGATIDNIFSNGDKETEYHYGEAEPTFKEEGIASNPSTIALNLTHFIQPKQFDRNTRLNRWLQKAVNAINEDTPVLKLPNLILRIAKLLDNCSDGMAQFKRYSDQIDKIWSICQSHINGFSIYSLCTLMKGISAFFTYAFSQPASNLLVAICKKLLPAVNYMSLTNLAVFISACTYIDLKSHPVCQYLPVFIKQVQAKLPQWITEEKDVGHLLYTIAILYAYQERINWKITVASQADGQHGPEARKPSVKSPDKYKNLSTLNFEIDLTKLKPAVPYAFKQLKDKILKPEYLHQYLLFLYVFSTNECNLLTDDQKNELNGYLKNFKNPSATICTSKLQTEVTKELERQLPGRYKIEDPIDTLPYDIFATVCDKNAKEVLIAVNVQGITHYCYADLVQSQDQRERVVKVRDAALKEMLGRRHPSIRFFSINGEKFKSSTITQFADASSGESAELNTYLLEKLQRLSLK